MKFGNSGFFSGDSALGNNGAEVDDLSSDDGIGFASPDAEDLDGAGANDLGDDSDDDVTPPPSKDKGSKTKAESKPAKVTKTQVKAKPEAKQIKSGKPAADKSGKAAKQPEVESFAEEDDDSAVDADALEADDESGADDDGFSADLIAEAVRHGFSEEEARDFGSPAALERSLARLDRQMSAMGRKLGQPGGEQKPEAKPEAPASQAAQQPAPQIKASEASTDASAGIKFDLNPEIWSEEAIADMRKIETNVNALLSDQAAKIARLENSTKSQSEQQQQAAARQHEATLDGLFDGLGDEYQDVYGKGPLRQLADDSPAAKARVEASREIAALRIADAIAGRPEDSVPNLFKRAIRSLHPDKIVATERKKIEREVQKRKDNAVYRASGSHKGDLSPRQIAAMKVEKRYRQLGALGAENDPTV